MPPAASLTLDALRARLSAPKDNPPPKPKEPTLDDRLETTSLRSQNNDLRKRLEETEKALVNERQLNKTILGIKEEPLPLLSLPAVHSSGGSPGVPMFLWSDWHVGECVDPEQVYGYNEFNIPIAQQRVNTLVNKSIDLATTHVTHPDYEYAVVILGGDFVSGWLHEELVATDCCTPLQAVRHAIQMLTAALRRMADAFKRLTIVCVPGNHGRLMKRPPAKLGAYQAFDWLIYGALQDFFVADDRMSFIIPAEGDIVLNVAGTRYLIMHGHELGVKGGDGLIGSIGPMMRGRLKAGRANASLGRDFDVLVLGHFHQSIWLPGSGLIVNNSLIGYSEYCKQMRFVATPPSQTMWFSHEKYGPIRGDQIFLEDNVDKPRLMG